MTTMVCLLTNKTIDGGGGSCLCLHFGSVLLSNQSNRQARHCSKWSPQPTMEFLSSGSFQDSGSTSNGDMEEEEEYMLYFREDQDQSHQSEWHQKRIFASKSYQFVLNTVRQQPVEDQVRHHGGTCKYHLKYMTASNSLGTSEPPFAPAKSEQTVHVCITEQLQLRLKIQPAAHEWHYGYLKWRSSAVVRWSGTGTSPRHMMHSNYCDPAQQNHFATLNCKKVKLMQESSGPIGASYYSSP